MKKTILLAAMMGVILFTHPSYSQTWNSTKRLSYTPDESQFPAIAVDSNNYIHVLWEYDTPGDSEIFHKMSTDGGATWTNETSDLQFLQHMLAKNCR